MMKVGFWSKITGFIKELFSDFDVIKVIRKFMWELIPVTCGIFLAIYLNNLNEQRKKEDNYLQIIKLTKIETKDNLRAIMENRAKLSVIPDTLNRYMNDQNLRLIDVVKKTKGINLPQIKNISFKILQNSDINFIAKYWSCFSLLVLQEDQIKFYDMKIKMLADYLFDNFNKTDRVTKEHLLMNVREVVQAIENLKENSDMLIKELDSIILE